MTKLGHFEGDVVTRWLTDPVGEDRNMELLQPFAFVDPNGKRWEAPIGQIINGATIPSWLWSTIGSPYVGNYRRASVVHDAACVARSEPSKAVHRMFYCAMRCDGVKPVEAIVMYFAVRTWGPSWDVEASAELAGLAPPPLDEAELERLRGAAAEAVAELGEDAAIEELEARMSDTTRRYVPPERR